MLHALHEHRVSLLYLLEVGCKAVKVLVIGQQGMALSTKHIVVPHSQQAKDDGNLDTQTHTKEREGRGGRGGRGSG